MPLEAIHEGRHDSGGDELSNHFAVFHTPLVEFENSLRGDGSAFHARHFGKLHYFSAAVAQTGELDDDIKRRRHLLAQSAFGKIDTGHKHHCLQAGQGIPGTVRVNRAYGSVMTRVHRLHHIQRFAAADLTDNDPVGAHTKCIADQIPRGYRALSFDIGRARFEPNDVILLKLQFSRVFYRNDSFIIGNEIR